MAKREAAIGKATAHGAQRAQIRTVRRDGWTTKRRRIFLDTLLATANVSASAKAAGMTATTAYALRRRDAGFREQWAEILDEAYDRLETELLDRSINGKVETVVTGSTTIERTVYSETAAINLLRLHRKSVHERRERQVPTRSAEEIMADFLQRLEMVEAEAAAAAPASGAPPEPSEGAA